MSQMLSTLPSMCMRWVELSRPYFYILCTECFGTCHWLQATYTMVLIRFCFATCTNSLGLEELKMAIEFLERGNRWIYCWSVEPGCRLWTLFEIAFETCEWRQVNLHREARTVNRMKLMFLLSWSNSFCFPNFGLGISLKGASKNIIDYVWSTWIYDVIDVICVNHNRKGKNWTDFRSDIASINDQGRDCNISSKARAASNECDLRDDRWDLFYGRVEWIRKIRRYECPV